MNSKLLCEKARKERAFLERGKQRAPRNVTKNALQTLQLAPSCSLSEGLESVIYVTFPWSMIGFLNLRLKPVQRRFLSIVQIHEIRRKFNPH